MAVYLSPGVYTREIDLSLVPSAQSALLPAFIGTANKGPMNTPTLITNSSQFIDTFGLPFATSYLGYAVLSYLQEGSTCYVVRVGVEFQEGMDSDLEDIAIDTSGGKVQGWGRVAVFSGIDSGIIRFREISTDLPAVFHDASMTFVDFTNGSGSGAEADLNFVDTDYVGCYDETFTMTLTSDVDTPTSDILEGCEYVIINSEGTELMTGTLHETSDPTVSEDIALVDENGTDLGVTFTVQVTGTGGDPLGAGDSFIFTGAPDNRHVEVSVENVAEASFDIAAGTYTTITAFQAAYDAAAALAGATAHGVVAAEDADGVDVPAIRTTSKGRWIQLIGTCAFGAEMGVSEYTYDIPRSYLVGLQSSPYVMTSSNNKVTIDLIENANAVTSETKQLDVTIPATGSSTAAQVCAVIDAAGGNVGGEDYVDSYPITIPGGTTHLLVVSSIDKMFTQLKLLADFSNLRVLRFADEVGINFPYTSEYRTYADPQGRVELPAASTGSALIPATCDVGDVSYDATQCDLDTNYYENIVGWFVGKYAGTWVDSYTLSLSIWDGAFDDNAGRYVLTIMDNSGVEVDRVTDISFDSSNARFVTEVINDGGTIVGENGNEFVQWVDRATWFSDYRAPAPINSSSFTGAGDGIPVSAAFSSELDRVVIGNPTLGSGIYSLQNPDIFDINLLIIPGFTSGTVIGQALQFCENRGDCLFIADPPIGLRPQQVVDWHNGIYTSDLAAAINSSYGALYWGWLKIADTYNGGTIWVPPSGYVAQVFARTARESEQWCAPAGLTRGRLTVPRDIEYNPTLGERDLLYGDQNAVNAIVKMINQGIVVWGQKTLQRSSTALNRVNVRMLMSFLKKELSQSLKSFAFEFNDEFTRSRIRTLIDSFLSDVLARRGVTAFNVVCDTTNNTSERIDRNELYVSVFVKPTRVAEFIVLNLVVLRSGANFSAQEVLAAGGVVTA